MFEESAIPWTVSKCRGSAVPQAYTAPTLFLASQEVYGEPGLVGRKYVEHPIDWLLSAL